MNGCLAVHTFVKEIFTSLSPSKCGNQIYSDVMSIVNKYFS